jgi:hypothetical protein
MKQQLLGKNVLMYLRYFACAGPNQILVKLRASGMNFTDIERTRGEAAGLCRGYQATIVRRFSLRLGRFAYN